MRAFTLASLLVLAATLSTPGRAQEAGSSTAAETANPPAASAATGGENASQSPAETGGFVAGEPAEDGDKRALKTGETYDVEKVGDWTVRCLKTASGDDPCTIYQLLKDKDGNPVAEVTVFRLPPGSNVAAGATFVVPLETLLVRNLTISVDGGPAKRYPFIFCNRVGCYARVGLTPQDLDAYKRGAQATVTIVPVTAPASPVDLKMSLKGFTKGIEKASVVQSPGQAGGN